MVRIKWPAVIVNVGRETSSFLALLRAVVVWLAERLPIVSIPEQLDVASMRDDVVYDRGRSNPSFSPAHHTEGVACEVGLPRLLPA